MGDDTSAGTHDTRIRAELRKLPGSHPCPAPGCTVITQGGLLGLRRHQEVVHGISYQAER